MDRLPHHLELGKRGQGLKRFSSLRCLSTLPCVSAVVRRDAVEQVLDCPLGVVVGGSEGGDALLPRESHGHELIDLRLILLVFRRLGRFLLLLGLGLFFLLGLGDGDFYFFFNFGFGLRLCDLGHDDEEVGLLESQFFDFFVVVGGLALEDDLLRIDGMPLLLADLLLEVGDGLAGVDLHREHLALQILYVNLQSAFVMNAEPLLTLYVVSCSFILKKWYYYRHV